MPQQAIESRTAAIRRFNRFYTRRIGVLHEKLADTRFSLTESRLLWELAHRGRATAAELARDLDLDPGYLSRLLRALKEQKLIASERSASDARHLHLSLSSAGRRAFAPLDRQSEADVAAMLAALPDAEQRRLVEAVAAIESILGERPRGASPCAAAGRRRLGHRSPRPPLRRRVRLGHPLRGARRPNRRRLHRALRPGPRSVLDRRARRRQRRQRLSRPGARRRHWHGRRRRGAAAPAAGRAGGARPRHRRAPRRRVRAVRARQGLPAHRPVD